MLLPNTFLSSLIFLIVVFKVQLVSTICFANTMDMIFGSESAGVAKKVKYYVYSLPWFYTTRFNVEPRFWNPPYDSLKFIKQQRRIGVYQMASLLLIFACEMPKYADIGGRGSKNGQVFRTSFMDRNGLFSIHLQCTPILYVQFNWDPDVVRIFRAKRFCSVFQNLHLIYLNA